MSFEDLMIKVNLDVFQERIQQNQKWGQQRHPVGVWLAILIEEVGEVGEAIQSYLNLVSAKETDAHDLYKELIQVAAVSSAIAEQIKEELEGDR